ncbi:MAG: hypothetical protein C0602_13090 [Denitrovibrio sp.]|nr:MAG: hypothetical protein C0602_13090 [Denitrovibrio sp.]
MDFYKMLSKHYDEIFPVSMDLVNMVKELAPEGGSVLDVGCATGAFIRKLCNEGFDASGLEYVPELVGFPERTKIGDMHHLPYEDSTFDTLICTGNTLAHVSSKEGAEQVLKEFSRVLKKGGKAVIQILNYEMILKKQLRELPLIQTENVRFKRSYEYLQNHIRFTGKLTVSSGTDDSYVVLYPLTESELSEIADNLNLRELGTFSSFAKAVFSKNDSMPLIKIFEKFD